MTTFKKNTDRQGETMSNLEWFINNQHGITFVLRQKLKKAYHADNGIELMRATIAELPENLLPAEEVLAKLVELIENEDAPL